MTLKAWVGMVCLLGLSNFAGATERSIINDDLEMTGYEYKALQQSRPELFGVWDAGSLQPILDAGKRNLDWLTFINAHRIPSQHLSLTSKDTEQGHPIDQPLLYNAEIIQKSFQELTSKLPGAMAQVILKGSAFTQNPPLAVADYLQWGLKVDLVYQLASRWLMMAPYLSDLASRRSGDIRGYYYLSRQRILENELAEWGSLVPTRQAQLGGWLVGLCGNSEAFSDCQSELKQTIAGHHDLNAFYKKYLPAAQTTYNNYFKMGWDRDDIVWSKSQPKVMHVPFIDPVKDDLRHFLKDNIEDEWHWTDWNLHLDFQPESTGGETAHLEFEPGATPHADIDNNAIVMDQNAPLTEYDVNWTIRHEFGHTLGFVDCYVEFYDEDQKVIISYQLDITNLMCSRRGKFKQIHFDELKRVYFK